MIILWSDDEAPNNSCCVLEMSGKDTAKDVQSIYFIWFYPRQSPSLDSLDLLSLLCCQYQATQQEMMMGSGLQPDLFLYRKDEDRQAMNRSKAYKIVRLLGADIVITSAYDVDWMAILIPPCPQHCLGTSILGESYDPQSAAALEAPLTGEVRLCCVLDM